MNHCHYFWSFQPEATQAETVQCNHPQWRLPIWRNVYRDMHVHSKSNTFCKRVENKEKNSWINYMCLGVGWSSDFHCLGRRPVLCPPVFREHLLNVYHAQGLVFGCSVSTGTRIWFFHPLVNCVNCPMLCVPMNCLKLLNFFCILKFPPKFWGCIYSTS